MPAALRQALREQRSAPGEIHKTHVRFSHGAQQVTITPLERRTRDYETNAGTPRLAEAGRDRGQPTVAVVVRQRYPRRHALHVLRRVQAITFDELDVERAREPRADHALAGAADAHDHVEPSVHSDLSYTTDGFGAILLALGTRAEPPHHVAAHTAQPDHRQLHCCRSVEVPALVVNDSSADAVKAQAAKGVKAAKDLADVARQLAPRRVVWVMVPAGAPVDHTIEQLAPHLARGDIVIDGGNSNFRDSLRRAEALRAQGIEFVDVGTSGGIWGLTLGYCLMIGASPAAFQHCEPIFRTLAPPEGYAHVGPCGAGHYVKMVHNGIEYGLLQAYAEGYEILHASQDFTLHLGQIAKLWNHGSVVRSWLNELAERAFSRDDQLAAVRGYVEDSGEGRWTVEEAMRLDVPAPVITLSLLARFRSRQEESFGAKVIAALRHEFGGHAVQTQ